MTRVLCLGEIRTDHKPHRSAKSKEITRSQEDGKKAVPFPLPCPRNRNLFINNDDKTMDFCCVLLEPLPNLYCALPINWHFEKCSGRRLFPKVACGYSAQGTIGRQFSPVRSTGRDFRRKSLTKNGNLLTHYSIAQGSSLTARFRLGEKVGNRPPGGYVVASQHGGLCAEYRTLPPGGRQPTYCDYCLQFE